MTAISAERSKRRITVPQGAQQVSSDPGTELTAVLGSCVGACLHDPVAGVGGMNHFLLPEPTPHASRNVVYGAQAMELLINAMLHRGARKDRMRAKLFGGANVMHGLSDVGAANAAFALHFLEEEAIPLVARSLGGTRARRVRFHPASGEAFMRAVADAPVETRPAPPPKPPSDITLF